MKVDVKWNIEVDSRIKKSRLKKSLSHLCIRHLYCLSDVLLKSTSVTFDTFLLFTFSLLFHKTTAVRNPSEKKSFARNTWDNTRDR